MHTSRDPEGRRKDLQQPTGTAVTTRDLQRLPQNRRDLPRPPEGLQQPERPSGTFRDVSGNSPRRQETPREPPEKPWGTPGSPHGPRNAQGRPGTARDAGMTLGRPGDPPGTSHDPGTPSDPAGTLDDPGTQWRPRASPLGMASGAARTPQREPASHSRVCPQAVALRAHRSSFDITACACSPHAAPTPSVCDNDGFARLVSHLRCIVHRHGPQCPML